MLELLKDKAFAYAVMAVLIFLATQGLKWSCVKPWTNKIKNERARKAVNIVIYFIPYGLGIALEYLYATYILQSDFSAVMGLIHGTSGIAFYGIFERIYMLVTGRSTNLKNVYEETEIGASVKEFMETIVSDGKVDENDSPALKAFLDKVRK